MPPKKETKEKAPKKEASKKEAPKKTWKAHLAEVYAAEKKKDPKFKYSDAMKKAKTTYKK